MKGWQPIFWLALAVGLALAAGLVVAAWSAPAEVLTALYDLSWWAVGGGGGTLEGAPYVLSATIGQAVVGAPLTGGDRYTLSSGFWPASPPAEPPGGELYLPIVIR
jgi:hypothetical protein